MPTFTRPAESVEAYCLSDESAPDWVQEYRKNHVCAVPGHFWVSKGHDGLTFCEHYALLRKKYPMEGEP